MRSIRWLVVSSLAAAAAWAPPAHALWEKMECNTFHPKTIDLSIQRKAGEVIKGPAKLIIQPINPLRYDVTIGSEVIVSDGPAVGSLGFIPAFPSAVSTKAAQAAAEKAPAASTAVAAAAGTGAPTASLVRELAARMVESSIPELPLAFEAEARQDSYEQALERFTAEMSARPLDGLVAWASAWSSSVPTSSRLRPPDIVELVYTRLQAELAGAEAELRKIRSDASGVKQELETARQLLEDLTHRSDQVLGDGRTADLVTQIGAVQTAIQQALAKIWPDTALLAAKLKSIGTELDELRGLEGYFAWSQRCDPAKGTCNAGRYRNAQEDIDELAKGLSAFAKGSDLEKAQADLRLGLRRSLPRLQGLSEKSFRIEHEVDCGFPFFASRTTKIQVVLVDRLETDKAKATRTLQVAEVICPSHFSVTAGVGVALIDERDFAFVEAPDEDGDGLKKVFGFDNRSSEQINPTFLINTRLVQCRSSDLHLSFGTLLDLDRPDSGAVFGYLGGITLSVKDSLFMTLGVQAQRVPELTGGFKVGDPVPADLTEPPLVGNWDFGPVLAVTYKLN